MNRTTKRPLLCRRPVHCLFLIYVVPRRDVKEDSKKLLAHFGTFANVLSASENALLSYGLTQNMATFFRVICVAHQRLAFGKLKQANNVVYTEFDTLIDYCKSATFLAEVEEFHVMLFDSHLHLIKDVLMQRGSVNSVPVYVRGIVKEVIEQKASSIVLFHNHPSGDCCPSEDDLKRTKEIVQALNLMQVKVHDHLIVSKDDYYSFRDHGLINFMR